MPETNTSPAAVSLKDNIIDLDGAKQKPSVAYEVVLENNTDFILRRQTQKVQKDLVILVSQGLYYIRDCKNGAIDPVTIGNLRSFLRDFWIICKSLIWSSPEFTTHLLAKCEKRLRREIRDQRYSWINPDTACHQLFGFMEALTLLGLLDRDKWIVMPDHFANAVSASKEVNRDEM